MVCPNCGAELEENVTYCKNCDCNIDDFFENEAEKEEKKSVKPKAKSDKSKKKASVKGDGKKNKSKMIKFTLIVVLAALLIGGILYIISLVAVPEGEKLVSNVPIGRDIAYAETKTGVVFTTISKYDALKTVASFESVCESDKGLKIEGIHLPEWAVTVSVANDKTIDRVIYYDFSQLQKSWKGHKSDAEIEKTRIEFGANEKAVEKAMGFKPYTIVKGIDNTTTYVYRYYYADSLSGDDTVCNYFVVFNDVDGKVKNVYSSELNYTSFMMSVQ